MRRLHDCYNLIFATSDFKVRVHSVMDQVCPPGERCTVVKSFSDSCALELSPLCISNGELQACYAGFVDLSLA